MSKSSDYYELGFHITPLAPKEEAEDIFDNVKDAIDDNAGKVLHDSVPEMTDLSYEIEIKDGNDKQLFGQAQFGWVQFSAGADTLDELEAAVADEDDIIRHLLIGIDEAELEENKADRDGLLETEGEEDE
jgi:ribosomal protein S6